MDGYPMDEYSFDVMHSLWFCNHYLLFIEISQFWLLLTGSGLHSFLILIEDHLNITKLPFQDRICRDGLISSIFQKDAINLHQCIQDITLLWVILVQFPGLARTRPKLAYFSRLFIIWLVFATNSIQIKKLSHNRFALFCDTCFSPGMWRNSRGQTWLHHTIASTCKFVASDSSVALVNQSFLCASRENWL